MERISTTIGEYKIYLVQDNGEGNMSLKSIRHTRLRNVEMFNLIHMLDQYTEVDKRVNLDILSSVYYIFNVIEKHSVDLGDYAYRDDEYMLLSAYKFYNTEALCLKKDSWGKWVRVSPPRNVFQRLNLELKIPV